MRRRAPPAPSAGSARGNKLMLSASASCIRKSGIAFSTVAAFFLAAACGPEKTDEGATTATHPLVVGSTVVYEAEVLARTASATGSQVTAEPGASAGKYVQLSGTPAAGAWIQFTLTNIAAGSYDLKLLYKSNHNRGI